MSISLATFALVFMRAIQQLNVIHERYLWAAITPFAIAAAEVAVIVLVVETGWKAVPFVGVGGSAGVLLAMLLHKRARSRWSK